MSTQLETKTDIFFQRCPAFELSVEVEDPAGVHDRRGHVQRAVPLAQPELSGDRLRLDPDRALQAPAEHDAAGVGPSHRVALRKD